MQTKYDSALQELQSLFSKLNNKEVQEALNANGGDLEKAIAYLRKKGDEAKTKSSGNIEEHDILLSGQDKKPVEPKDKKTEKLEAKKAKEQRKLLRRRAYSMVNSGMGVDFITSDVKPRPRNPKRRAYSMEEPARISDVAAPIKVRRAGTLVQKLTRSFSSLFRKKSAAPTKPTNAEVQAIKLPEAGAHDSVGVS